MCRGLCNSDGQREEGDSKVAGAWCALVHHIHQKAEDRRGVGYVLTKCLPWGRSCFCEKKGGCAEVRLYNATSV